MDSNKRKFPDLELSQQFQEESFNHVILNSIQEAILILDKNLKIIYANEVSCNSIQTPINEIKNQPVGFVLSGFTHANNAVASIENTFKELFKTGIPIKNKPFIFQKKSKETFPVSLSASLNTYYPEEVLIVLSFIDLTEWAYSDNLVNNLKTQYEKLLSENQKEHTDFLERFHLISLATEDTIYDWDLLTNKIWFNEGFSKYFGYTKEEASSEIGMQLWESCLHPDDKDRIKASLENYIKENNSHWTEIYRFRHKDGFYKTVVDRGYILINEAGKPHRMVGCISDITNAQSLKEKLVESEERLKLALTATQLGIFDLNPQTMELKWDNKGKELFGLNAEDKVDFEYFLSLIHPEDLPKILRASADSFNPFIKAEYKVEYRIFRSNDHAERWIKAAGKVLFNENNEPYRFIGTGMDITEEKLAELKLKESEERFKNLADSVPIMIWMSDETGKIRYINKFLTEFLGVTENQFDENWYHLIHPDDLKNVLNIYTNILNAPKDYVLECRIRDKFNYYKWFLFKGTPRYFDDNLITGLIGIGIDINDRKEAEKALTLSFERFRFLAESMPQKVWTADKFGIINYMNSQWYNYTGSTFDESKEMKWVNYIHPDDRELTLKSWIEGIQTGNETSMELRIRNKEGMYRWHLSRGVPQKGKGGLVQMWVGTNTDIHDYKIALENFDKVNVQLRKSNTELDNFIYTASHDLKAPISNLEGLIGAFLQEGELNAAQLKIMDLLSNSVERLKTTIQDLTITIKEQKNLEEDYQSLKFDEMINEVLLDMTSIVNKHLPEIIVVTEVKEIVYSRKNLRSILYNIISNALKYSSPERKPKITLKTEKIDSYILLSVSDNGLGISKEDQDKVFGIFKRAHEHVEGTGVGLYIIKRIIENAGGKIEVESNLNVGTTFRIFLKAAF